MEVEPMYTFLTLVSATTMLSLSTGQSMVAMMQWMRSTGPQGKGWTVMAMGHMLQASVEVKRMVLQKK